MIAQPFFDGEMIRSYIVQTKLIDQIMDDLDDKKNYKPDLNDLWLAAHDDNGLAGLCSFNLINSITLEIHPFFAKKEKGRKGIITCLKWLKKQTHRRVDKIVASIPVCYKSVYNCAKKIGFTDEGVCKNSFLKNGKVYDRFYLGLDLSKVEFS